MGIVGIRRWGAMPPISLTSSFVPHRLLSSLLVLSLLPLSSISRRGLPSFWQAREPEGNCQSFFVAGGSVEALPHLRVSLLNFPPLCKTYRSRNYSEGKAGANPLTSTAPSISPVLQPWPGALLRTLETQKNATSVRGAGSLESATLSLSLFSSVVGSSTRPLLSRVAFPACSSLPAQSHPYRPPRSLSFSAPRCAHISPPPCRSACTHSPPRLTPPSFSPVRTLPVVPGSPGLRLFTLALAHGRLAELPPLENSKGSRFLLLDTDGTVESFRRCNRKSALETTEAQQEITMSPSSLQQCQQAIQGLLKTVPVYAVATGDLHKVVPASFPSSFAEPSHEEDLEDRTQPTLEASPVRTRKRLQDLVCSQLQALQTLENRHADDGGLGLFFISPRDAEVYLHHVRSQLRSEGSTRSQEDAAAQLCIATTSLANVYSLLLRPRPSLLPQRSKISGKSASLSVLKQLFRGRGHFSMTGDAEGTFAPGGGDGQAKSSDCSRYILVPDTSELDLILTETGRESFKGTPLYFVADQRKDENLGFVTDFSVVALDPSSRPVVPLYLSRVDAEAALRRTIAASRKPQRRSRWGWFLRDKRTSTDELRVGVISLESFLERLVGGLDLSPSKEIETRSCSFVLVPPRHSFEYCRQHGPQEALGSSLFSPLQKLSAHPAMRKLAWWRRRVIREIVKPVVSVVFGEAKEEEPVGDLLPDSA